MNTVDALCIKHGRRREGRPLRPEVGESGSPSAHKNLEYASINCLPLNCPQPLPILHTARLKNSPCRSACRCSCNPPTRPLCINYRSRQILGGAVSGEGDSNPISFRIMATRSSCCCSRGVVRESCDKRRERRKKKRRRENAQIFARDHDCVFFSFYVLRSDDGLGVVMWVALKGCRVLWLT